MGRCDHAKTERNIEFIPLPPPTNDNTQSVYLFGAKCSFALVKAFCGINCVELLKMTCADYDQDLVLI